MNMWLEKYQREMKLDESRTASPRWYKTKTIWTKQGKRDLKVPKKGMPIIYKDIEIYPPIFSENGEQITSYEIPEIEWQGANLPNAKKEIDDLYRQFNEIKNDFPEDMIKDIHDFIHLSYRD